MRKRWRRGNDESSFPTLFVDKNPPWHSFPYSEACFPCSLSTIFVHMRAFQLQPFPVSVLPVCEWLRFALSCTWKTLVQRGNSVDETWAMTESIILILFFINANNLSPVSPKKSAFAQMNAREASWSIRHWNDYYDNQWEQKGGTGWRKSVSGCFPRGEGVQGVSWVSCVGKSATCFLDQGAPFAEVSLSFFLRLFSSNGL